MTREDIESFDFVYRKPIMLHDQYLFTNVEDKHIGDLYENKKMNTILAYYFHSSRISMITEDPAKNDYYAMYNKDNFAIGSLKIETKEEFKFILDRLPEY